MNHLSTKYEFCSVERGVACVKSEVKYYSLTKIVSCTIISKAIANIHGVVICY